jgi:hypothetical protein
MNSASLCSLAGRYENPIPPRCLAPIDFLKIPALVYVHGIKVVESRNIPVIEEEKFLPIPFKIQLLEGNLSPKTEGTKTKAAIRHFFLMSVPSCTY